MAKKALVIGTKIFRFKNMVKKAVSNWAKNILLRKNGLKKERNSDQNISLWKNGEQSVSYLDKKIFCFEKMVKKA